MNYFEKQAPLKEKFLRLHTLLKRKLQYRICRAGSTELVFKLFEFKIKIQN